jgi:hypothetical protein
MYRYTECLYACGYSRAQNIGLAGFSRLYFAVDLFL